MGGFRIGLVVGAGWAINMQLPRLQSPDRDTGGCVETSPFINSNHAIPIPITDLGELH